MNKTQLNLGRLGAAAVVLATLIGIGPAPKAALAACGPNNQSDSCSPSYGVDGNVGALTGDSTTDPSVSSAQILPAGPLLYNDYKDLEAAARALLDRSVRFRQDISPYRGINNFNDLVRHFDEHAGFSAVYSGTTSLQDRIDLAVADLKQARDLYGVLAVYAPVDRLRADDGANPAFPGPNYKNALCANAENPSPADPQHTGQVLDPVVDWCDFPARLRQSVREAAYLRMIFGQQFKVDALGLHFSAGTLLGGEAFVRQEVAKLQAAKFQFELAQLGLSEGLGVKLGSGCYLSDFYSQSEWSLLSRAAEEQLSAQHEIATRLSYMDINTSSDVARAQNQALDVYRAGSIEGYVKLIGMTGLATVSGRCTASGARPGNAETGELALSVIDTAAKAREMRDGRNIFGFDLRFTPARPYHTAFGSTDKGLWEQAKEAADLALIIQQQTENSERVFDLNQQDLTKAILATNNKVDNEIQIEAGCDLQAFANDTQWYSCIDGMIANTTACDPQSTGFDACMNRTIDGLPPRSDGTNWVVLVSDMRTSRQDLRVAWLGVEAARVRRDNLLKRADTETMRNTKVKSALYTGAQENSAFEAIIAAAQFVDVDTTGVVTFHPGAVVEAALRPAQIMRQAAHDMEIEDANSDAVVRNFFLDMAEAQGEVDVALQQYQSALTQFNGVVGQTGHDVFQSKREHAYTVSLPANDPAYRMTRDSRRLELAKQLETAARQAYLAARRAEYEYTARLSGSNFRISDIYKARTANDVLTFLSNLDATIANLPGSVKDAETNQSDMTISVAQHVLGLSDRYLQGLGFTGPAIEAERTRRFRKWVSDNTVLGGDGKPALIFSMTLSSDTKGILNNVVQQGYDFYWLHKVAGIGQPKQGSNGFGLNLVTAQTGELGYRQVRVSQSGQVVLTSLAGCQFDYRLIPPAVLLGLDFPNNQPSDEVTGIFNGDVNGKHGNTSAGYSTSAFLGRPLASNGWQVVLYAASPNGILPDLDLQQLNDLELKISTVHATRSSNAPPQGTQCVRADF